ncbi:hypothetical protein ABZ379_50065 [Streptomyces canus]|uniref:hypothetical protein n=1 Tax=Streptomyces canus TaxID=58343 RepID=UPI0033FE713D
MNDNGPTNPSDAVADQATAAKHARGGLLRTSAKKKGLWVAATGVSCALAGFAWAGTSSAATVTADASPSVAPSPSDGGARSDPADGGATGIVDTTSASGFTFSTATGVKVTVKETSATKYTAKTHRTVKKAVHSGESVLVLGLVDSASITATQVIVQPGGDGGAAAAKAAGVIAFQKGTPSPTKSVGTIPDYTEGEGTIVSGATAYKVTKTAQAVVPGGIADRVVKLNDGSYEVHNISVNWPHHVFVSKDFKVLGYE